MTEVFAHLYLPGPSETLPFTTPQSGGGGFHNPPRRRAEHAAKLLGELDAAWLEAVNRRSVSRSVRGGVYVEFVSEPGFELVFQSLERIKSGVRLLNVRRRLMEGGEETLATVFIPDEKRSLILRKIERYASEQTESGSPKNAKLVESISAVRLALLESFWIGDIARIPGDQPEWVELWIRTESSDPLAIVTTRAIDVLHEVDSHLKKLVIESRDEVLEFPERAVRLVRASRAQLAGLIEQTDWVAEFRPAMAVAGDVLRLPNKDQSTLLESLLSRCSFDESASVSVCVLDTGVNGGHALLRTVVDPGDCQAVRPKWGVEDHQWHGTAMAGMVAYGDLLQALTDVQPLRVRHRVESVKILPPKEPNPKELWGEITSQAVSRAEIQAPGRQRVVCMAVTASEDRRQGRPTAWSGAVDKIASGYADDAKRLVVLASGNADFRSDYPVANLSDEVHDPAQAWNALAVGAFTEKTAITQPGLAAYRAVAPSGGLSPHTTCSCTWPSGKWPIKPEVLFEGGNVALGPGGSVGVCDDLSLISTYLDPQVSQFVAFGETSAASAQAAHMAARLQVQYPAAWPETVRAAIVHSAEWTDEMKRQFPAANKSDHEMRVRACGYGVPSFDRAAFCMRDSLTLVAQAAIQPFELKGDEVATKEMHYYKLPWPTEVLAGLGETQVNMRVTLSYFVEPSPGEIGWQDRYRYASHGLRFEVNGPTEAEDEFKQRINKQARNDDEHPGTSGPGDRWTLGRARNVGSIHSDIWSGTAAELAASNLVGVFPTIGWWRERKHLGRVERQSRYALLVSIHVPPVGVDIYTPVAVQVGIPVTIPAS